MCCRNKNIVSFSFSIGSSRRCIQPYRNTYSSCLQQIYSNLLRVTSSAVARHMQTLHCKEWSERVAPSLIEIQSFPVLTANIKAQLFILVIQDAVRLYIFKCGSSKQHTSIYRNFYFVLLQICNSRNSTFAIKKVNNGKFYIFKWIFGIQ